MPGTSHWVTCVAVCALATGTVAQTPLGLNLQVVGRQAQIAVTGVPGTACQVQWTDTLAVTSRWSHLGHLVLSNPPSLLTDLISSTGTCRYYRAVWTPNTNLVWISPGTFVMGSPTDEPARFDDEGPQTQVTLSRGFWMRKYEVTGGEYQDLMTNNPSYAAAPYLPVDRVTWYDATNYCAILTARERSASRLPAGYEYRLPTEAEWEYACRAGTSTPFHYGNELRAGMACFNEKYEYPPCAPSGWHCWNPNGISWEVPHPPGWYAPNAWGLYDMHGNTMEWCRDWYGPYPGGNLLDPDGPATGARRVIRGGGQGSAALACRSAFRLKNEPADRDLYHVGLRVVLAPTQP